MFAPNLAFRIKFKEEHLQILAKRGFFDIGPNLYVKEITARYLIALSDYGLTALDIGRAGYPLKDYFHSYKRRGRPRKPDQELKYPRRPRPPKRPPVPRSLRGKDIWFWRGQWRLRSDSQSD